MDKRGGVGIIVLVLVVIVALGVGGYFVFFGDSKAVSGYSYEVPDFNTDELCEYMDGENGEEICQIALDSIFYSNSQESNDVILFQTTRGNNVFKSFVKSFCGEPLWDCDSVSNVIVDGKSYDVQKLIYWYYENDKYISIKQWGSNMGILESPVVEHLLKKYPPISI